ncbi:TPA: hypothetical protein ACJ1F6_002112, partial [Streptococcus pneumoniae]
QHLQYLLKPKHYKIYSHQHSKQYHLLYLLYTVVRALSANTEPLTIGKADENIETIPSPTTNALKLFLVAVYLLLL